MQLQREEDIRQYIEARLNQQGVAFEREVACGNGIRADLVTPDMVIEIKRRLNRGTLYQAYGQGVAYQKLLNKPKLLIIGLAPTSEAKYQEAQRIAENVRAESVEVVFIDKDPNWGLAAAGVTLGAKPAGKPAGKPGIARLPFEPVTASIVGTVAEKVAEKIVEKAAEKIAEKAAEKTAEKPAEASATKAKPTEAVLPATPKADPPSAPPPPASAKPARPLKDFWRLLLLILVFLWIRAYLWHSQAPIPRLADPLAPPAAPPAAPLRKPRPQPPSPAPVQGS